MPARTDDDTIRNLLQSAAARLERAETYNAKTRSELTCEDAQQTAEFALKALIKVHGSIYKRTHEIEHLLERSSTSARRSPRLSSRPGS